MQGQGRCEPNDKDIAITKPLYCIVKSNSMFYRLMFNDLGPSLMVFFCGMSQTVKYRWILGREVSYHGDDVTHIVLGHSAHVTNI